MKGMSPAFFKKSATSDKKIPIHVKERVFLRAS